MPAADLHGLALTGAAPPIADACNGVLRGYLDYRVDTPKRLRELLAADPEFGFGQLLKGYFSMLSFNEANLPAARDALAEARRLLAQATLRERAHVEALALWAGGDVDATLSAWEDILAACPLDVLAFRLHHFVAFWHGRPDLMGAQAEAALRHWRPALAGWPTLLACRCFAEEELGHYAVAERAGRDAIDLDPGNLWAAHGVAHVMEMQGRNEEGLAWLATLEPHWESGNNIKHHLWWHRALYHCERREFAEVLALYDRRFRNLASPITQSQPDLYIDVQNAASMLFRLERQGVDVGNRWEELADKAEARIGDCLSVFTLPHWMLALVGAGRLDAAGRMVESMRAFANSRAGSAAPLVRDLALPIGEAILARGQGKPKLACERMRPALAGMHRLGGSHAQQDVLEQLFLDCAVAAGQTGDVRLLIERVRERHPVPPERRVGYGDALKVLN